MTTVFLVADTHFGHDNICTFTDIYQNPIRPWTNAAEMDEAMVAAWNDVVRPNDKVYHLGDVVINKKHLPTMGRLNGDKILIKGNHDIFKLAQYTPYFRDIRAYHRLDKMILTHIPIHPSSIARFGTNVHGHLHTNEVMLEGLPDPRYLCVSMEHINFTPISLEDVRLRISERQRQFEGTN